MPFPVQGFLIDLDGTVVESQALIPGALDALAFLDQKHLPYRIVTNTTSKPGSSILGQLHLLGLKLPPEQLFTAPRIGREYLLQHGFTRCFPLLKPSLLEDLEGIEFCDQSPQAVLIGDLGDDLTYTSLNHAFRFLLDGAAFITLARNRYFRGADGLCLDVGSIVAALEYATQREATLIGKPAPEFFHLACQSMGISPENVVVIGDDLEADVGGAQAAGCVGVLVKTGKFQPGQLNKSAIHPDALLDSLAHLSELC